MDMTSIQGPLTGGAMIGMAAAGLLLLTGKTAGVSGALYGVVTGERGEFPWQFAFVLGLVLGGVMLGQFMPQALPASAGSSLPLLGLGGLLVGFGARLGGGCTSGHGVCGMGRLSRRSVVATCSFMAVAMATVFLVRISGGSLS
ncbi:YeeE/YedE family protein [bacterium]|nr:MAG: YeeE/YedE family protein [bacterium]RIK65556.1 MAG: YeeE/YedE family protein [Planctomycetota bacterium]